VAEAEGGSSAGIPTGDNTHEVAQRVQAIAQRVYNERVSTPQTLRTREQVARFFTGLDLVEPGLVQVHQWRPDPSDFAPEGVVSAHGGVARKASA
jgi:hypothetical protein